MKRLIRVLVDASSAVPRVDNSVFIPTISLQLVPLQLVMTEPCRAWDLDSDIPNGEGCVVEVKRFSLTNLFKI